MADLVHTPITLNKVLQNLAISMLYATELAAWGAYQATPTGTAPANPYKSVRVAWPTDGAPAWTVDEDVVIIQATPEDSDIDKQMDVVIDAVDDTVVSETYTSMRLWSVKWVFYGPNAFNNARLLRSGMLRQLATDTLFNNRLALVTDTRQITRIPEEWQNLWYERADLVIRLNELCTEINEEQYVTSAEVAIYKEDGVQIGHITAQEET